MKRYAFYTVATGVLVAPLAFQEATPVHLQPTFPGAAQHGNSNITGTSRAGTFEGWSSTSSGIAYGGDFRSVSTSGRGVLGNASATSGATYGGLFQAWSTQGRAVAGIAPATTGTNYGGFFSSASVIGRAVYGQATATSGLNYGVYGKTSSPEGYAGFFEGNLGTTGMIFGNGGGLFNVWTTSLVGEIQEASLPSFVARRNSPNTFTQNIHFTGGFTGVGPRLAPFGSGERFGISSDTGSWVGMYVTSSQAGGLPYYGYRNANHGAWSYLDANGNLAFTVGSSTPLSVSPSGTVGIGTTGGPAQLEVRHDQDGESGLSVSNGGTPTETGRTGISAVSSGNGMTVGVNARALGTGSSYAVHANARGTGPENIGVYSFASSANVCFAGYFDGTLFASSASSGVKSFLIDHPLDPANKYLEHSSVESDQRMNVYRGVAVTDAQGYATVPLPSWFSALNEEIQYQLTVVDTVDTADFILTKVVKKFDGRTFRIRTSQPRTEVNWQISGVRHDPTSNYHPLQVEREKRGHERGRYLQPRAFGKDDGLAIVSPRGTRPEANRRP